MAKDIRKKETKTQPIKWRKAQRLLKLLEHDKDYNNLLLFSCGFYFGLRISDLLKITWGDLLGDKFSIKETKTGKFRNIEIHPTLKGIIERVYDGQRTEPSDSDFVFVSQRIKSATIENKSITVHAANHRLKKIFSKYEIAVENASSHTLRKTFARRIYEANNESEAALILLAEMLNHRNTAVTRAYIGITEQKIKNAYLNM